MDNYLLVISKLAAVVLIAEAWFVTRSYLTKLFKKQNVPPINSTPLPVVWKNTGQVHGALFFPDFSMTCPYLCQDDLSGDLWKSQNGAPICRNPDCRFVHLKNGDDKSNSAFRQFIKLLYSAKKSLDVCVWIFSLSLLGDICLSLHNRNVVVRVIIGDRDHQTPGTQIPRLKNAGIDIRYCPQMNMGYMHNKFAIVDDSFVATGSLNWTRSAIYNNYENVIVTSEQEIVKRYIDYYHKLWNKFDKRV